MTQGVQIMVTDTQSDPPQDREVQIFRELPVERGLHMIAEAGYVFVHSDYHIGLGAGNNLDYVIETPSGAAAPRVHITTSSIHADTSPLLVYLYEAPTYSGGTPVVPLNRERENTRAAQSVLKEAPTVTAVGTRLMARLIAGTLQAGGQVPSEETEWMLKKGTAYLIRFVNNAVGVANLTADIEFHEVPAGAS